MNPRLLHACRSILLALLVAGLARAAGAPPAGHAAAATRDSVVNPHALTPGRVALPPARPETGPGWRLPPGHAAPITRSEPGPALQPGEKLKMKTVTLHVFHRVFKDFHDRVDVRLRQEFRIGDSDYTGVIVGFVPDFALDLKTHKVATRGQEPNNPAWRVVVRKSGVPVDTTWAFMDVTPHFTARSLLGFVATRATFENHGAVTSRDSLAMRLLKSEGR